MKEQANPLGSKGMAHTFAKLITGPLYLAAGDLLEIFELLKPSKVPLAFILAGDSDCMAHKSCCTEKRMCNCIVLQINQYIDIKDIV